MKYAEMVLFFISIIYWITCSVVVGFDMTHWWAQDIRVRKSGGRVNVSYYVTFSLIFILMLVLSPVVILAFAVIHTKELRET